MSFSELPSVSKRKITSFLDYRSAVRLSNISKDVHSDVTLSLLSPRYELVYSQIVHGESVTGDIPIKSARVPIFGDNPHTVVLKCRWKDQGWGERKGRLFVVAHSEENDNDDRQANEHFENGKVVYRSPVASHSFENLSIAFSPQKRTKYHLWYIVGGGGGHLLIVEDLFVETLVFDDASKTMKNTYAGLCKNGVIRGEEDNNSDLVFFTKLLMAILKVRSEEPYSLVASTCFDDLFQKEGLSVSDPLSITSMSSVCSFFQQYLELSCDYNPEKFLPKKEKICWDDPVPLSPFTIFPYITWEEKPGDFQPVKCSRIPFMKGRTDSIRLTCTWQDQGYGPSEGKLYVVAEKEPTGTASDNGDPQRPFLSGRRLVWESPIVTHELTSLETSFTPDDDERYFLYQHPGGTGIYNDDFILHVNSLCIHLTVYDDEMGYLESCFNKFLQDGALDSRQGNSPSFQMKLLLAAISFLRTVGQSSQSTDLHNFFVSNNFGVDNESLRSLQELMISLLKFKEQEMAGSILKASTDLRMFSCM